MSAFSASVPPPPFPLPSRLPSPLHVTRKLSPEKETDLLLCLPRLRSRTVTTQQVASAIGVSKNTVAQERDGLRGRATLRRPTVLTQAA